MMGLFVVLATAVFSWGVQYKTSLYRAETSSSVPAAKLLSERERPAVEAEAPVSRPENLPPVAGQLAFAFMMAWLYLSVPTLRFVCTTAILSWRYNQESTRVFFSFRPPPAPFPAR